MIESLVAQTVLGMKAILLAGLSLLTSDDLASTLSGRCPVRETRCVHVEIRRFDAGFPDLEALVAEAAAPQAAVRARAALVVEAARARAEAAAVVDPST